MELKEIFKNESEGLKRFPKVRATFEQWVEGYLRI